MSLISVIVPVYKAEKYIHRCVDSILAQSFEDFSLVLINDGSPDHCGAICDEYAEKDSRVHVIHQENGGPAMARNAGLNWVIRHTDSSWIAFVDSDDWVHTDYLRAMLSAAQEKNCLLCVCDYFVSNGEEIPNQQNFNDILLSADDFFCEMESDGNQSIPVCKLYHRSLFQTLRFPQGCFAEDEFVIFRTIYAAGMIVKIDAKLYAYFHNTESVTNVSWHPKKMDALEALKEQMAYAHEVQNIRLLARAADGYVWNLTRQILQIGEALSQHPEYKLYEKKLREELRQILKTGFEGRKYLLIRKNLELYEVAYPLPMWKTLHQIYGKLKKNQ